MDTNNWRPPQVAEPSTDAGDWRSQLQPDSRQRIVNTIMDKLKRQVPFSGQEGLEILKNIAVRFEEMIYTAATSQSDYLHKIALKMHSVEAKSLQSNFAGNSSRPPDPVSFGMQPQDPKQGQSLDMPLSANQSQSDQQLLSQNNIPHSGLQSSAGLSSVIPPSGLTQTNIPSIVGQNPNMQSMSGTSQNSLGNSMGYGVPPHSCANSQRKMQGRQQVVPQQRQQSQNSQSSQQSVMQTSSVMPSVVQSSLSSLHQNQLRAIQQSTQSRLEHHPESVLRKPQQQPQEASVQGLQQQHQTSLDPTSQTVHATGCDWQEVVYQKNLLTHPKAGTSSSPLVIPSPRTSMAPAPTPGVSEKPSSLSNAGNIGHQPAIGVGVQVQSLAIGTPGISASPLLAESCVPDGTHVNSLSTISGKSSVTEQPLERLIKVVKSMSPNALSASVSDIGSVVSMSDRVAGSAPGNGSRAAVGEDLIAMAKCPLQEKNVLTRDGTNGSRKMRRHTSAMPLNVVSSACNDSFMQLSSSQTADLESTAISRIKRPRIEANNALLEEIRDIRRRFTNIVVDITDEDDDRSVATADGGEGTIFKCFFDAVAFSPNLKSQYASAQMSPIQPLRLLIPTDYPNSSPILLDKFPAEVSKVHEDLSVKAKSRFSTYLRRISEPMSLGEIARIWDVCARAVISEHAQQSGGGSFSSKYGSWENCLSAA